MNTRAFILALGLVAGASVPPACSKGNDNAADPNTLDAGQSGSDAQTDAGVDPDAEVDGGEPVDFGPRPEPDAYLPRPAPTGLAPTPPMGWSSWNKFACQINAAVVRQIADVMESSGMVAAGYQYVNIDDCWALAERAADGSVQVGANFPDGIKPVADYVHGKGLKLGIYSSRGPKTCAGRVGSEGYEALDAANYAAWGVDYLKYDNCLPTTLDQRTQYQTMKDALTATGRPIVYSLCAWNFYEWGIGMGQLWRTTSDIKDTWESLIGNFLTNRNFAAYAGPNGWNDPDMLEVGNGALTIEEYRAHFSLWAVASAPLIAGNDLRYMTDAIKTILTNAEAIAVNQDALGLQGTDVRMDGDLSVWAKPLNESGARAVVLLNNGTTAADITVNFAEIGLWGAEADVRDLWAGQPLGTFERSYTANVAPRAAVMLKVSGAEPAPPAGSVDLGDVQWIYAANGLGPVERNRSNGASARGDGAGISLRGTSYDKGLGVAGPSAVIYRLGGVCTSFSAEIGVDDSTNGSGSVVFQVFADAEKMYESGVLDGSSAAESVTVDLTGKHRLKLMVTNAGDGNSWDRASWANAKIECAP